jgi:hypothetical protein
MKAFKYLVLTAFVAIGGLFMGKLAAESGDFTTLGFDSANGYSFWRVDSSGHFKPGVASTLDIGTSALPVRTIYAGTVTGTGALSGTTITGSGIVQGAGLVSTTYVQFGSKTIAAINATTATVVGQAYFCTTCTDDVICVSTGTATDHEWVGNNGARAVCS